MNHTASTLADEVIAAVLGDDITDRRISEPDVHDEIADYLRAEEIDTSELGWIDPARLPEVREYAEQYVRKLRGGRPAVGKAFSVKFPSDLLADVDGLAAHRGVSRAELLRSAAERAVEASTVYLFETDLTVYIGRGADEEAWGLDDQDASLPEVGNFADDAAAWINGEWAPTVADGWHQEPVSQLRPVAAWTPWGGVSVDPDVAPGKNARGYLGAAEPLMARLMSVQLTGQAEARVRAESE